MNESGGDVQTEKGAATQSVKRTKAGSRWLYIWEASDISQETL